MRSRLWRSIQSGLPESAHDSPELVKHASLVEVDGMSRNSDYGHDGAAGVWATPPHPPGPQDLSGLRAGPEPRTPPPIPPGPQYLPGTTGWMEQRTD